MVTVIDAKKLINVCSIELENINLDLKDCAGFAVSANVFSPMDFPDFEQSAMDGYGIMLENGEKADRYTLKGEEQAGNTEKINIIQQGEAIRIFTGAKIPEGVNTVIQQEWVERNGDEICMKENPVHIGMNIRPKGSQTKKGELVLKKGSPLYPATIGLLAGLGIDKINVIRKPKVIIITTGKELVTPGNEIQNGQIFESNSFALSQALADLHIMPVEIYSVDDDKPLLIEKFSKVLGMCDLLLVTGGVSVGDYDFVTEALEINGVKQIFHKVKQKPGKPLYFGKKENTLVFGLPGNPASVLTCFYQYVYPCIKKMMGFARTELKQIQLPVLNDYEKKAGLTHFLKAQINEQGAELLSHQESYKMNSFAIADVLIEVEEDKTIIQKNDLVKVYLLHI